MHFVQEEGRVFRTLEDKEINETFTEKDFKADNPPEASGAKEGTSQVPPPPKKKKVQKVKPTIEVGQSSSSSSTIEERLVAFGEQLTALKTDVNRIGNDVQSMNTLLQTILQHVELQTRLYQEFTKQSEAAPEAKEPDK